MCESCNTYKQLSKEAVPGNGYLWAVIILITNLNTKNMSMISGLVKNLRELIGQSNNHEVSEKHPDQLLKENRIYKTFSPVRYTPSADSKLKLQEVRNY